MRPAFSRPTPMADSRFIESMRYAHNTRTLELVMHGKRYRYYGVGERKATRLAAAPSAGAYYNAQIKGRHPRRKFRVKPPEFTPEAASWNKAHGHVAYQMGYEETLNPWAEPYLAAAGLSYVGGIFHRGSYYSTLATAPHLVELATGEVITQRDILDQPVD